MAALPDTATTGASGEIRAVFDAQTIRVYQAYPDAVADTASHRETCERSG